MVGKRNTTSDKRSKHSYSTPWSYRPTTATRKRADETIAILSGGDPQMARGLKSEMMEKGMRSILPEYEAKASFPVPKLGSKNPTSSNSKTP